MKPARSALDVTATGSAATDEERLARLRGRCQHTMFLQNVTLRLLKSCAFKEKKGPDSLCDVILYHRRI